VFQSKHVLTLDSFPASTFLVRIAQPVRFSLQLSPSITPFLHNTHTNNRISPSPNPGLGPAFDRHCAVADRHRPRQSALRSQTRPTTRVDSARPKTGATHTRHPRHNIEQPWTTLRTGTPHILRPSVLYPCPSNSIPKPRRAVKRASLVSVITSSLRLQSRVPQHAHYHLPPPACPYPFRQIQMLSLATYSRQRRRLHQPRLRLQLLAVVSPVGPLQQDHLSICL
jgi:hypothetical protein